jgi:hypothetical protein
VRRAGWLLGLALMAGIARASAATDGNEPPAPAAASESEKEIFCRDSASHHLPDLIGEAASSLLGHGFHFDSFQAVPVPPPSEDTHGAPVVATNFRIQVMDEQSQAREIKVQVTADGHPVNAVKSHWMCWLPADPATAQRLDPSLQNSQEAKR